MNDGQQYTPQNTAGGTPGGPRVGAQPDIGRPAAPMQPAPAGPRPPQPMPGYPVYPGSAPMPQVPGASQPPMPQKPKNSAAKGFAIAGFILALIGLFAVIWQYNKYLSPFGTVGLVMSVVGLLLPEKGEDRNRITFIFAVVGIIISILVLIATLVIGIFDLKPFLY